MMKTQSKSKTVRPKIKVESAVRFLELLDSKETHFSFRTFTDNPLRKPRDGVDPLAKKLDGSFKELEKQLKALNRKGAAVCVVVNAGGHTKESIHGVRAQFADQDTAGPLVKLGKLPKPHMIVESSPSKYHLYWLVSDGQLETFSGVQKAIAQALETDASVTDVCRVMRLPGFIHQKTKALYRTKLRKIRPKLAPYTVAKLIAGLPPKTRKLSVAAEKRSADKQPKPFVHRDVLKQAVKFAKLVHSGEYNRDKAFDLLVNQSRKYTKREVPNDELLRAFDGAIAKLKSGQLALATPQDDDRPSIVYRKGFSHKAAAEAEQALLQSSRDIYQRGDQLVRVVSKRNRGASSKAEVPMLVKVTPPWLSSALTEVARCETVKHNGLEIVRHAEEWPPLVIQSILSHFGEWRFRHLQGLIEVPLLRMNGKVVMRTGYHAPTKLYVAVKKDWPNIPSKLSKTRAIAALKALSGLINSFPFITDADKSVVLAAMLTTMVRPILDRAPMIALSAPLAGAGKSKITEIISILATGRKPTMYKWGKNAAESEKRLGAALMRGEPFVCFDNVQAMVDGDLLCAMLTSESVSTRVLGQSKMVTLPMSTMLMVNGNNLVIAGDTTRRVLVAKLDPEVEHPEDRYFAFDPVERALAHRDQYVNAALTILGAFLQSKAQPKMKAFGSFERWSSLVRGSLIWLGCTDPLEVLTSIRDDDPKKQTLRELVTSWHNAFGSQEKTAAEVIAEAESGHHNDLRIVLANVAIGKAGKLDSTSLGNYLRSNKDRLIGKMKIVRHGENRGGSVMWKVDKLMSKVRG